MTKFKGRIFAALLAVSILAGCVTKEGASGVTNIFGIMSAPAEEDTLFHQGLLAVKTGDYWGYIDKSGKYVIVPQFEDVENFDENGFAKVKLSGKWGEIDKNGNFVIEPQFSDVWSFAENGLARVKVNEKYGYIDKSGDFAIEPQFDFARDFVENGLACVEVNEKWGYIDKTGNFMIKPQFDDARDFAENGTACVKIVGNWGYIDTNGSFIINPQFDYAYNFSDSEMARVRLGDYGVDGKYGYIDINGDYVIDPQFYSANDFTENELAVVETCEWAGEGYFCPYGIIDKTGSFVVEPQFYLIEDFDENGLAFVRNSDSIGYIDSSGDFVAQRRVGEVNKIQVLPCRDYLYRPNCSFIHGISYNPQYMCLYDFSENGLAPAILNDEKWGFVDKAGKFIINPQFDNAQHFAKNGLACVGLGEKCGYIDQKGEFVIELKFDWFGTGKYVNGATWEEIDTNSDFYDDNYAVVKVDELYGIIDSQGNYIANPQFDNVKFE